MGWLAPPGRRDFDRMNRMDRMGEHLWTDDMRVPRCAGAGRTTTNCTVQHSRNQRKRMTGRFRDRTIKRDLTSGAWSGFAANRILPS